MVDVSLKNTVSDYLKIEMKRCFMFMSKIGVTQQHILTNWLFENIRERRVCVFFSC